MISTEAVTLTLAGVAFLVALGALWQSLRTSGARLAREFGELAADVALARDQMATLRSDQQGIRTEWERAHLALNDVLREATEQVVKADKKRRAAREAERRAEDAGDGGGQAGACQHGVDPVMCIECAKARFRAQGHPV